MEGSAIQSRSAFTVASCCLAICATTASCPVAANSEVHAIRKDEGSTGHRAVHERAAIDLVSGVE